MGQAKLRKSLIPTMVWHHTSALRTNLLWMSGKILPEGAGGTIIHPTFGEMPNSTASFRRDLSDFPALAWFTTQISVPKCLQQNTLIFQQPNGRMEKKHLTAEECNEIALQRVALGFNIADIGVVPWKDHPGSETPEGRELNATARQAGDSPSDWYVSEQPVDLLKMAELRTSKTIQRPKLERNDAYLAETLELVRRCQENPEIYVPPSWMTQEQAIAYVKQMQAA